MVEYSQVNDVMTYIDDAVAIHFLKILIKDFFSK